MKNSETYPKTYESGRYESDGLGNKISNKIQYRSIIVVKNKLEECKFFESFDGVSSEFCHFIK